MGKLILSLYCRWYLLYFQECPSLKLLNFWRMFCIRAVLLSVPATELVSLQTVVTSSPASCQQWPTLATPRISREPACLSCFRVSSSAWRCFPPPHFLPWLKCGSWAAILAPNGASELQGMQRLLSSQCRSCGAGSSYIWLLGLCRQPYSSGYIMMTHGYNV